MLPLSRHIINFLKDIENVRKIVSLNLHTSLRQYNQLILIVRSAQFYTVICLIFLLPNFQKTIDYLPKRHDKFEINFYLRTLGF